MPHGDHGHVPHEPVLGAHPFLVRQPGVQPSSAWQASPWHTTDLSGRSLSSVSACPLSYPLTSAVSPQLLIFPSMRSPLTAAAMGGELGTPTFAPTLRPGPQYGATASFHQPPHGNEGGLPYLSSQATYQGEPTPVSGASSVETLVYPPPGPLQREENGAPSFFCHVPSFAAEPQVDPEGLGASKRHDAAPHYKSQQTGSSRGASLHERVVSSKEESGARRGQFRQASESYRRDLHPEQAESLRYSSGTPSVVSERIEGLPSNAYQNGGALEMSGSHLRLPAYHTLDHAHHHHHHHHPCHPHYHRHHHAMRYAVPNGGGAHGFYGPGNIHMHSSALGRGSPRIAEPCLHCSHGPSHGADYRAHGHEAKQTMSKENQGETSAAQNRRKFIHEERATMESAIPTRLEQRADEDAGESSIDTESEGDTPVDSEPAMNGLVLQRLSQYQADAIDEVLSETAREIGLSRTEHAALKMDLFRNYIRNYDALRDAIDGQRLQCIIHPILAEFVAKNVMDMEAIMAAERTHDAPSSIPNVPEFRHGAVFAHRVVMIGRLQGKIVSTFALDVSKKSRVSTLIKRLAALAEAPQALIRVTHKGNCIDELQRATLEEAGITDGSAVEFYVLTDKSENKLTAASLQSYKTVDVPAIVETAAALAMSTRIGGGHTTRTTVSIVGDTPDFDFGVLDDVPTDTSNLVPSMAAMERMAKHYSNTLITKGNHSQRIGQRGRDAQHPCSCSCAVCGPNPATTLPVDVTR